MLHGLLTLSSFFGSKFYAHSLPQPLRMLPLSLWSWQNAVKAVLGGKAVVVETYPDVFVRAVSINMPVPSVIALRDYAPTGRAVSFYCDQKWPFIDHIMHLTCMF